MRLCIRNPWKTRWRARRSSRATGKRSSSRCSCTSPSKHLMNTHDATTGIYRSHAARSLIHRHRPAHSGDIFDYFVFRQLEYKMRRALFFFIRFYSRVLWLWSKMSVRRSIRLHNYYSLRNPLGKLIITGKPANLHLTGATAASSQQSFDLTDWSIANRNNWVRALQICTVASSVETAQGSLGYLEM